MAHQFTLLPNPTTTNPTALPVEQTATSPTINIAPSVATNVATVTTNADSLPLSLIRVSEPQPVIPRAGAGRIAATSAVEPPLDTLNSDSANNNKVNNEAGSRQAHIVPNPLNVFASSTYQLTLHILKKSTYNKLVQNSNEQYSADYVLISPAGKGIGTASSIPRHSEFETDFYIDDLTIETVVGLGNTNGATNAVTISFKILEANSVSLIERLIKTAVSVGYRNHHEAVYALQIDFFGFDDTGVSVPLLEQQKIIPIKIITLGVKISPTGSEYSIEAVPYGHVGYSEAVARLPVNIEISGDTIGKIISDKQNTATNSTISNERAESSATPKSQYKTVSSASLIGAMNAYYADLKASNSISVPDIYTVEFLDDKIKNALPAEVALTDNDNVATNTSNAKTPTGHALTRINGGTSIIDELTRIVRTSSYITDQLNDPTDTTSNKTDAPLRWFKITSKVELLDYCESRSVYAKHTTYIIQPWIINDSEHPYAPRSKISGAVKQYNYIYTGKNIDVLNFEIDYNFMYFVPYTAKPTAGIGTDQNAKTKNNGSSGDSINIIVNTAPTDARPVNQRTTDSTIATQHSTPADIHPFVIPKLPQGSISTVTSTNNKNQTKKSAMAAELSNYLLNRRGGDQIVLDLTILGDPTLIKQDDVFFGHSAKRNGIRNSIIMDSGEVYAECIFKVPLSDFDPVTGLLQKVGETMQTSIFSGFFIVITIDNTFNGGKFEQRLHLVRKFDGADKKLEITGQPEKKTLPNISNGERAVDATPSVSASASQFTSIPTDVAVSNGTPIVAASPTNNAIAQTAATTLHNVNTAVTSTAISPAGNVTLPVGSLASASSINPPANVLPNLITSPTLGTAKNNVGEYLTVINN